MLTFPSVRGIRVVALLTFLAADSFAQINILTNRYNQSRTASNLNETQLNTSNVNTGSFGKLGSYSVDGVIYAQPLYVQGITVNGATHNVVFVATMHDVLYAFDADNVGSLPLWTIDFRNLLNGIVPAPVRYGMGDGSNASIADTFGIMGTPVIDLPNNHIFFVTQTFENGVECFRLRSVDIRSGALVASTLITGSVPATSTGASVSIDNSKYGQRCALELVNGQVYVALGSRPTGDTLKPYQGWFMTYNSTTLAQTGIFATSRTSGNSIFEMGNGPAIDANGNAYVLTGNGGNYDGVNEFPESLLKFSFGSTLTLNDWYTPDNSGGNDNYSFMNLYDLDLGCNGPVLIPGTDLITFGSKTADLYLMHTGSLGHLTPNDTQLAQFFHVGAPHDYTSDLSDRIVGMAYWPQTNGGSLYVWPGEDALHVYTLNASAANYTQSYVGSFNLLGEPSTALALSANGTNSATGILWAPTMNTPVPINTVGEPGILHAYNASNPAQELWNSGMVASDFMGTIAKFVPPVVANGKVYIANSAVVGDYGAGSVTVFGLKTNASNNAPYSTLISPANGTVFTVGSQVTLSGTAYASSNVSKVMFMDGTSVLSTQTTGVQGAYIYTWSAAGVGSHTITMVVVDQNGNPTVSFASTIMVVASQVVNLTASPASVTVRPGSSGNTQINITPVNGYSGTVTFLIINGLPAGVSSTITNTATNVFTVALSASPTAALATTNLTVTAGANGGIVGSFLLPVAISQGAAFTPGQNTVSFTVPSGVTLGTPIVYTEGVPSSSLINPDYSLISSGNTCTGNPAGTCSVTVQFNPQYSGLRRGAVQLVSSSNSVLSTSYFYGSASVAQLAWAPATLKTIYSSGSTHGAAIDGAGNVFLLNSWNNTVYKIAPGGAPGVVPLGLTLNSPFGLALDAVGNLYIADAGNNRIVELPTGSSTAVVLNITGLNFPEGVTVDGIGNLFIANTRATVASGAGNIIEVAAGSGTQTSLGVGLSYPSGVAVDGTGNLFIADWGNNRVLELPASGASPISLGTGLANASGVAIDGSGDLFITDQNHSLLVEIPATSNGSATGTQTTVATGLVNPYGLALDGQGDVFIVEAGTSATPGGLAEVQNANAMPGQNITFGTIPTQAAGSYVTLTASASSGLPITYVSLTNGICTLSGSTATLLTAGTCTITASQAGSKVYPAAVPVSQTFTVSGTAQTIILPFSVPSGQTLGTPVVFTEGVPSSSLPSPDFTLVSNTCAGSTAGTCSVSVKFNPRYGGLRRGAVKLVNSAGGVLSTYYFYANGSALVSPPAWVTQSQKTIYSAGATRGVAVDGAGDIFLINTWNNRVYRIAPGGTPTALTVGITLSSPYGLALDAAGNLYIGNSGNNQVLELPYGGVSAVALNITGLNYPEGFAVDGLGNLFIANTKIATSSGQGNVLELSPSGVQTTVVASGLNVPSGVAVDAAGDLFIADKANGRVLELPVSGSPISIGTGLSYASTVAVDALGDIFITDQFNNRLVEVPATSSGPGTGTQVNVATGLVSPYGLALDGNGNVFLSNAGNSSTAGNLIEIPN